MRDKTECCETVSPDYQSEYYRQQELIKKLYSENQELRDTIMGMCKTLFMKGGEG
jgi:hypothetical protein